MSATQPNPGRRALIRWSAAAALGFSQPALQFAAHAAPRTGEGALDETERALHALNRFSWGPAPGDLDRVRGTGALEWLRQQLQSASGSSSESESLKARLNAQETTGLSCGEMFQRYGPPGQEGIADPEQKQLAQRRANAVVSRDLRRSRLWRATETRQPLLDVMTAFWFNHFNVFLEKGNVRYWLADYEATLRRHALGRFRDLLGAVARHPAMLFYLDNWNSVGTDSPVAQRQKSGLNENYARELLELHTLGVNGGYTQDDVIALARILTGWTIDLPAMRRGERNAGFQFDPRRHDGGDKLLLGQSFRANGAAEGERALDLLASHPSTARFIATKLVRRFVNANLPEPALVDHLARRFTATDGDLRSVLGALIEHPAFWARKHAQKQFKTPFQFVVSALRASGTPVNNFEPIVGLLAQLGQPLYGWSTPDGYSDTQDAWLSPAALLRRIEFATALGRGNHPVAQAERPPTFGNETLPVPAMLPAPARPGLGNLLETLGPVFSTQTVRIASQAEARLQAGLLLGSPEFMYY